MFYRPRLPCGPRFQTRENPKRRYFARRALKAFGARYDYDVSYLSHMLDVSPGAFFKFAGLNKLAQHREAAPKEAVYAAKLVGALAAWLPPACYHGP